MKKEKTIHWIAKKCNLTEKEIITIVTSYMPKRRHKKTTPEEKSEHSKKMLQARREKLGW